MAITKPVAFPEERFAAAVRRAATVDPDAPFPGLSRCLLFSVPLLLLCGGAAYAFYDPLVCRR